jgi:hypothetical protein
MTPLVTKHMNMEVQVDYREDSDDDLSPAELEALHRSASLFEGSMNSTFGSFHIDLNDTQNDPEDFETPPSLEQAPKKSKSTGNFSATSEKDYGYEEAAPDPKPQETDYGYEDAAPTTAASGLVLLVVDDPVTVLCSETYHLRHRCVPSDALHAEVARPVHPFRKGS